MLLFDLHFVSHQGLDVTFERLGAWEVSLKMPSYIFDMDSLLHSNVLKILKRIFNIFKLYIFKVFGDLKTEGKGL